MKKLDNEANRKYKFRKSVTCGSQVRSHRRQSNILQNTLIKKISSSMVADLDGKSSDPKGEGNVRDTYGST